MVRPYRKKILYSLLLDSNTQGKDLLGKIKIWIFETNAGFT